MMRNRNFRILEYDKIIDLLAAYASSDMVKKRCLKLKPVSDLMEIEKRQDEPMPLTRACCATATCPLQD